MNNKIALCYDFDVTLCSGYMQNQQLIPDCKIDIGEFWVRLLSMQEKIKLTPPCLIC